jgi:hypothetical protein
MTTDAPPLLREIALGLFKTALAVVALAVVYPSVIGALARVFAGR